MVIDAKWEFTKKCLYYMCDHLAASLMEAVESMPDEVIEEASKTPDYAKRLVVQHMEMMDQARRDRSAQ